METRQVVCTLHTLRLLPLLRPLHRPHPPHMEICSLEYHLCWRLYPWLCLCLCSSLASFSSSLAWRRLCCLRRLALLGLAFHLRQGRSAGLYLRASQHAVSVLRPLFRSTPANRRSLRRV